MFGIGRNANATFKPAKRAPAGSRRFELHKHAEATLGAGNLCQAVKCPTGENLNDWWRSVIKGPWLTAARAVTHSSRGPPAGSGPLSELERRDLAALVPAQERLILLSLTIQARRQRVRLLQRDLTALRCTDRRVHAGVLPLYDGWLQP